MKKGLSNRQQLIYDFIKQHVLEKGFPPSVREIGEAVGLNSTSTVHNHLKKIEDLGYIKRDKTKPRTIEILEFHQTPATINQAPPRETAYIPMVGQVTAGQPILATENITDTFPLPADFVESGEYFMLQIKGDSMIEAGILDHDFVLVRKQQDAKNGEIVIALIEDSATCKTFYKESNRIRLQPENSNMDPIYVQQMSILGIVKGVYRKF